MAQIKAEIWWLNEIYMLVTQILGYLNTARTKIAQSLKAILNENSIVNIVNEINTPKSLECYIVVIFTYGIPDKSYNKETYINQKSL